MHYLLYAVTLLVSSALLFVVQPMVAKMIQPVLGGTPAVWNTAMVFFQALLLGGYLYAHLTTRWLGTRRQAIVHLIIMLVGLAFLPVAFEAPGDTAVLDAPTGWLLITLFVGVGWPFFVVSTSAPLLQKWFSTLDHPQAADPYHLYAASNAGSVLALLGYPFVIEPRIGLQAQSILWMIAYLVLCAAVAICAALLWRSPPPEPSKSPQKSPPASGIRLSWRRRGRWILWAFIPSSMMLSVTTFITTDIAPVPLLWIPPLAIYMLSFIAVFSRQNPIPHHWWLVLFAPLLAAASLLLWTDATDPLWAVTAVHFAALFVFCMVFHGLLAADRPHTRDLTEFYLWLAVGGVLGGAFNALAAPALFDRIVEYPVILVAAALVVPTAAYGRRSFRWAMILSLVGAAAVIIYDVLDGAPPETKALVPMGIVALATVGAAVFVIARARHWAPLLIAALVAVVAAGELRPEANEIYAERSFFGTHQVKRSTSGFHHVLYHGRTVHGAQARDEEFRQFPLNYYYFTGPLGQVFDHLDHRPVRHPIALVGLGTGAAVTYARPGQEVDIFEIDPAVEEIATNRHLFTYVDDCPGDCHIHLGDGRLLIGEVDEKYYELIVLDAYSSAAIPVHLLTREAIATYMRRLRPDGFLAIHISSPYLDLAPPLLAAADDLGLARRVQQHVVDDDDPLYDFFVDSSRWVLIAHSEQALGDLADDDRWEKVPRDSRIDAWTDDYANILDVYQF